MDIKRTDEKFIEEWNKQEICQLEDGTTSLEKWQQQKIDELEAKIRKLEIENNLMKELLTRPVTYTYGVR